MKKKNTLQPMTSQEFTAYVASGALSHVVLSRAIMFACNQCTIGKDGKPRSNTQPLNDLLKADSMQSKKHKFYQLGAAVVAYVGERLHGAVDFQAERGRFQFVTKSAPLATIDWTSVPSFADYFAKKKAESKPASGDVKLVTAAAVAKLVADVVKNGLKDGADVETLDAINKALPDFQRRINDAHAAAQSVTADNAPSVTDGSTGDYSRREAHASADDKAVAVKPAKPAKPEKLAALVKAYAKPEKAAA